MAVFAAATASPTDGAAQSCTKRKEGNLSIKAITSYFSPLGKNVESALSPPKSNNIMDYLRKPPINENAPSPLLEQESKANSISLENSSKPPSKPKWRGKRNNLNNKLKTDKTLEPEPLVEVNKDNDKETANPQEENCKPSFMNHNDIALISLTNGEQTLNVCSEGYINKVSYKNEERKTKIEGNVVKSNAKKLKRRKPKNDMDLFENSTTETQTKDSHKETNKQIASVTESENKTVVLTLDPEARAQITPYNTVTVSFEDFLKSQGEDVEQIPRKQTPDDFVASDKTDIDQDTQDLPLKKVTVLAQIHSIPPKSLRSQKIASIFVNQKSKAKVKKSPASSEMEYLEKVTQKRKSNVVIAEEELELAVLESAGSETVKSKCTAEERYQFMKAFRQPGADVVKNGAKRGPNKQKEVEEKPSSHELEGEECEDDSNQKTANNALIAYGSGTAHDITEKCDSTRVRNKSKKRKGIVEAKENDFNVNDNQNNNAHDPINRTTPTEKERGFSQKSKRLRRHCQQKGRRSTPEKAMVPQAITENPPDACPLQTSTPKTNRSFKNDLYTAEVITEPFDSNSPIRMKFTRIINTSDRFTQQNVKMNSTSRNIFKAKKLVEKAKAVQHNRISRTVEEAFHVSLRRSSRQRALAEKKHLEKIENSGALDSGTVSDHIENPKKLQSVNDVLGKKTKFVKATKKSNGKEKMSLAIRKKNKKSTDEAVFIKSSEDESENSQDDTEFKAKREFLMSGLPESLKKKIAKKAVVLEAYSAVNSCFQKVIHVQQKNDECLMWRLAPPSCSFLTKDVNSEVTDVAKLTLSLGELSVLTTQLNSNDSVVVPSGWRPVFSKMQRDVLLEEIQSFNAQFPVKLFFDLLLKKQAPPENSKQVNKCESVNSETITVEVQKEGKRKRKTEDRKCKRKNRKEKSELELSKSPSQIPGAKPIGAENSLLIDMDKAKESEMKITEDSQSGSKITCLSDFASEDTLWTEKYQPQNSSELIGNIEAIKKLHRWLCEWKRKASWEENRTQKEKKNGSKDDSSEHLDFIDDTSVSDEENVLCNTMLLIGPPGIGKTAAVYACAQELGFKIFEVNASCQRSGRQILSQLKEATQSHQVNKQGVHAHKPCFFNHYSGTKSPKKQSPRKEWSPRKFSVSPRKVGLKQGLMPKTLDNYFKLTSKLKNQEVPRSNKENRKSLKTEKKPELKSGERRNKEEESSNKCATSLILFEEVDIIFDEDIGFLNAVKTFMSTTKRPVILTTNDPLFSETFDGCFEQITFRVPSLMNVASYLQVLCLAENLRTDIRDFAALLTVNNCDIRQSILYLQFWVQSGGGYLKEKGTRTEINVQQNVSIEESTSSNSKQPILETIPKCSTGCTENLLGLKNIFLPSEDLFSFLKHEIRTKEDWNRLIHVLTEFQMRNTDFTYSNLEIISSLPLNIIPEAIEIPSPVCSFIAEKASSSTCIEIDYLEGAPPVKKAKRSKCQKKMAVLDDSDLFERGLNYSGFVTLSPDTSTSCLEETGPAEPMNVGTVAPKDGTSVSAKDSVLVSQCLTSLTEYLDNMSFLDCCFTEPTQASKQAGKYGDFIWTKGKIKNGLSDEFSVEHTDWWSSQSSSELKATMEALSFNKCSKSISKIMESCLNCNKTLRKNELEELTLCVSKEQADLYFGRSAANSSVHYNAQKRIELIKNVFSSTHLNLNSRQASVMEYLPILRNICKSEKQKQQGKTKRRFLHYLEGIHLPKEILNSLAADFP
ncbi:ATPase family AAA domain-containing protein 5 isoform X1 [Pantherophis guttatus]|uniref:ATPase family AAA domain-containing protein 5 isoform X1 n=1 Tax=Pantherophis guttatus TaxID=94885 RepID=A0A6P9BAT7_PANGU|nr:ATPase family AAA domain-containing protein 5 isoform X1 [Pantherophis guttatus]